MLKIKILDQYRKDILLAEEAVSSVIAGKDVYMETSSSFFIRHINIAIMEGRISHENVKATDVTGDLLVDRLGIEAKDIDAAIGDLNDKQDWLTWSDDSPLNKKEYILEFDI